MTIIDKITKSIRCSTAIAPTGNLPCVVHYNGNSLYNDNVFVGQVEQTTPINNVAAIIVPEPTVQNQTFDLWYCSVYNPNPESHTVSFFLVDTSGPTTVTIHRCVVPSLHRAEYIKGRGWLVYDPNGVGSTSISNGATFQATPADPATTTSLIGVMMGLAGSITPAKSGKIGIFISGNIDNSANNNGAAIQIRTGTGAAPVNGAALTGTPRGSQSIAVSSNNIQRFPANCNVVITGLTVGTPYWIDLSLAAISGGTARVRDISISAFEII